MNALWITVVVSASLVGADAANSRWMGDYGDALRASKAAGRPLLIVLDVPSDPRQRIQQVAYQDDRTQSALLQPYQLCHIDVTTSYGGKVAAAFRATQFPFTAIIDKTGAAILYKKSGRFSVGDWTTTLVRHQSGERQIIPTSAYTSRSGQYSGSAYSTGYGARSGWFSGSGFSSRSTMCFT